MPKTILVVENEPLLLKFLSRILTKAGYRVLAASTAEEALRIEANFEGEIDVLLTALTLPRLSGTGLAEKLEWKRGLPVMLASSLAEASTIAEDHNWHYLDKPFDISTRLAMIRTALDDGKDLSS